MGACPDLKIFFRKGVVFAKIKHIECIKFKKYKQNSKNLRFRQKKKEAWYYKYHLFAQTQLQNLQLTKCLHKNTVRFNFMTLNIVRPSNFPKSPPPFSNKKFWTNRHSAHQFHVQISSKKKREKQICVHALLKFSIIIAHTPSQANTT